MTIEYIIIDDTNDAEAKDLIIDSDGKLKLIDIERKTIGEGINFPSSYLYSENGSRFSLKVSNDGQLSCERIYYYSDIVIDCDDEINIGENQSFTFNIKLNSEIDTNQIVNLNLENETYCNIDKNELTFTPENYNTNQEIIITAVHNNNDYSNHSVNLTLTSNEKTKIIKKHLNYS